MTNQEAIEYMGNEISCIKTASKDLCNRDCSKCDLVKEDAPLIKAYDMAIEALKRQIPKKPYKDNEDGVYEKEYCPTCNRSLFPNEHYCICGQAIDWSEEGNTRLDLMRECAEVE